MGKGWYLESVPHSMAAKGISLGRSKKGKFKNIKTYNPKDDEIKALGKNDNPIYQRITNDLGHIPNISEIAEEKINTKDKYLFHVEELKKLAKEENPDPLAVSYHAKQVKHYRAINKREQQERLIHASKNIKFE